MNMGYIEGTPCCLSDEALQQLKQKFLVKYDQYLSDKQALWLAGFIVDGKASLMKQEHIYRHQTKPYLTSHGFVWHGWVRNEIDVLDPIDHKGQIRYSHKYHHMQPIYFKCETVTGDMITEELVTNILDIGDTFEYVRAMGREMREYRNPRKPRVVDMSRYEE